MKPECTVIVFAKAPVPGYAKTRLARALGAEGAAHLAARMLSETLVKAVEAGIGPIELCCAPDDAHPAFRHAASVHGVRLTVQGEGDLGARMHRAMVRNLAHCRSAVLIGTDAPGLGPTTLREAARLLDSQPAVFAPAVDGGYVLVGLSQPMPDVFDGISWSTDRVMAQTRARLTQRGLRCAELETFADVDEYDDLEHVPKEWLE